LNDDEMKLGENEWSTFKDSLPRWVLESDDVSQSAHQSISA
jgi:hypothetical protein